MVRSVHRGASGRIGAVRRFDAMGSPSVSRPTPPFWVAAIPRVLRAGVLCLPLLALGAIAGTHEATQFSVPAGSPDEYMQAGPQDDRERDPTVEIRLPAAESGPAEQSRAEGGNVECK